MFHRGVNTAPKYVTLPMIKKTKNLINLKQYTKEKNLILIKSVTHLVTQ